MNELKLNLGRFDQCIECLSNGQNATHSVCSGTEVFYYMSHDGDIVSTKLVGDCVHIPTFDVGASIRNGRICDQQVLNYLLSCIELDIFTMIKRILQESGRDVRLENISIPIHSLTPQFFNDNKGDGCYGWVQVGIAITV